MELTSELFLKRTSITRLFIFLSMYVLCFLLSIKLAPDFAVPILLLITISPPIIIYVARNNFNLVLLYIALLPLVQHLNIYSIKVSDFVISPHMIFQGVIMFVVAADYFISTDGYDNNSLQKLDKLLLLFVFLSIPSLIFGYSLPVNHEKRWLLFYTGMFEPLILYFIVFYYLSKDSTNIKKIVIALLFTSLSSLIVASIELRSIGLDAVKIYLSRMRIGFGYHNTNLYGIHSTLLVPIVVYALQSKEFKETRLFALVSLLILSILTILCFNRGTIISIGMELLLLLFLKNSRRIVYWIFVGLIVFCIIFNKVILFYALRFFGGETGTYSNVSPLLDSSASYRLDAWKTGLKLLFYFPWGMGAGSFQYGWMMYGTDPSIYLGTPHELFLSIGVDYGVIPLILFIGILFIAVNQCWELSKIKLGNVENSLYQHIIISIIGFVLYGLVTDGELSHLTGFRIPNNGYTLVLVTLFAIVSSGMVESSRKRVSLV